MIGAIVESAPTEMKRLAPKAANAKVPAEGEQPGHRRHSGEPRGRQLLGDRNSGERHRRDQIAGEPCGAIVAQGYEQPIASLRRDGHANPRTHRRNRTAKRV